MAVRGVRGAITVHSNTKKEIVESTKQLLEEIILVNKIKVKDIAAIFFSSTPDLNAEFPAIAARSLGWLYTPLLCTNEIKVPGSLKKCVRVMMIINSARLQAKIKYIYLKGAAQLRPDRRIL